MPTERACRRVAEFPIFIGNRLGIRKEKHYLTPFDRTCRRAQVVPLTALSNVEGQSPQRAQRKHKTIKIKLCEPAEGGQALRLVTLSLVEGSPVEG